MYACHLCVSLVCICPSVCADSLIVSLSFRRCVTSTRCVHLRIDTKSALSDMTADTQLPPQGLFSGVVCKVIGVKGISHLMGTSKGLLYAGLEVKMSSWSSCWMT